jgi:hypothetical protein
LELVRSNIDYKSTKLFSQATTIVIITFFHRFITNKWVSLTKHTDKVLTSLNLLELLFNIFTLKEFLNTNVSYLSYISYNLGLKNVFPNL